MRVIKLLGVLALTALLGACSARVPAGNVGVKFDLYGGDKGVTGEVVGPGKYWLGWNEELYLFPTFSQNYTWALGKDNNESLSFQDKEGIVLNADLGISYYIEGQRAGDVFQKYRKGVDELTDIVLRSMARDALNRYASTMDAEKIYGTEKTGLIAKVQEDVAAQVKPLGIVVEKIYWIGAIRLPESLLASVNAKVAATQKAQQRENELQTAAAQAQIEREKARGEADALVIAAKGQAEANKLLSDSISDRLLRLKEVEKWNGTVPQVTGGASPFINLK